MKLSCELIRGNNWLYIDKTMYIEKLLSQGKNQLNRYLEDKRLSQRANLKKYVVMFIGFEDVIIKEI